jgi:hypothetical protein
MSNQRYHWKIRFIQKPIIIHTQYDIEVDETLVKIHVHNLQIVN